MKFPMPGNGFIRNPQTTYVSALDETVRFRIEPRLGEEGVYFELRENGNKATAVFPPADARALALAILNAADCHDNDAGTTQR